MHQITVWHSSLSYSCSIIDNAYVCDPRIKRFKEEEKDRKAKEKKAKQEAARTAAMEREKVMTVAKMGINDLIFCKKRMSVKKSFLVIGEQMLHFSYPSDLKFRNYHLKSFLTHSI